MIIKKLKRNKHKGVKMADKKKIPTPKIVQNLIKAVYLTTFTFVLTFILVVVGFFFYGSSVTDPLPLYVVAQVIVIWAYINGSIKINGE